MATSSLLLNAYANQSKRMYHKKKKRKHTFATKNSSTAKQKPWCTKRLCKNLNLKRNQNPTVKPFEFLDQLVEFEDELHEEVTA